MVVGRAGFLFFLLQPLLSFFFLLMVVVGFSPGSTKTMVVEGAGANVASLLASSHIAETTMVNGKKKHHFILVHGIWHGAWFWYKLATLLSSSAGHRVTALDMAACGASPGRPEEVSSFEEYSRPLRATVAGLPPDEKVVLVGHSFGGLSLALTMEQFPERVAIAVFVTAFMPATRKPMLFVFQQDLTLAMAMVRPSQRFRNDTMIKGNVLLTAERYGAVRRVCVVTEDDLTIPAAYQRQMASWNPGTEVRGLQGADHMAMLSKPTELSELLMKVADKYS